MRYDACKLVRMRFPKLSIVWGGVHGSLLPEQVLQSGMADVVVVGEGEETFIRLVEALASRSTLDRVEGIAYRDNGTCRFTGPRAFVDLDRQPPLSYKLGQYGPLPAEALRNRPC